jgi:hypothetical protein
MKENTESTRKGKFNAFKNKLQSSMNKHYYLWIIAVFALSFSTKLLITYTSEGLGTDYGAYLRLADTIRGLDITGNGLRYPPLFPLVLNGFLFFFDELTALRVLAALIYSIIAAPFFLLTRKIFKNPIIPVIASLLIVFNLFYSEMMGWGGNANVMALGFMILFFLFWLNSLENPNPRWNIVFASITLSLAIGTHYLVGVYIIVFFLVFFVFLKLFATKLKIAKAMRKTLIIGLATSIFSIPYIFSYTYLLNSTIVQETGFAVADQLSLVNVAYLLSKNITNIILLFLGILGIYILIKRNKLVGLITASLLISACLLLVTQHPVRWVYFWPIPVFLGISALIDEFLYKRQKYLKNASDLIVTLGVFVLIFAYMASSVIFLQQAIEYYNPLTSETFAALRWLRNSTAGNSVIATSGPCRRGGEGVGQSYGWWIEGYSDRRCIATSYLRFLIYNDEKVLAEKANIVFSGSDVLSNNYVMAAETFGVGQGNTEVGVNIGDFYEKILFFSDNATMISYEDGSFRSNITFYQMKTKSKAVMQGENLATINVTYSADEDFIANKAITISGDSSSIEISFKIQTKNNVTGLTIPIFRSDFVDLDSIVQSSNRNLSVGVTTPMRVYLQAGIAAECEANTKVKIIVNSSPGEDAEIASFSFSNLQRSASVIFRLNFPKLVNGSLSLVRYSNSYDLIKTLEINYVFVNKKRTREFLWLGSDKVHFLKEFENGEIAIFKVASP